MLFLIFIVGIILVGFCMFLNNAVNENSKPDNLEDDYNRYQLKDYYKPQSSESFTHQEKFTYEDFKRFNVVGVVPGYLFIKMQKAYLKGESSVLVPKGTKSSLEVEYKKRLLFNETLCKVADLNNKGIALEKEGKIQEAINTYEENVASSNYPAHHSYKRLMVIYRRNKDYVNELRIIKRALDVFPQEEEYIKRKERTLYLMNK